MRISYLLMGFGKNGGYIVLYNFMDELVRRGYNVFAITPNQSLEWEVGIWKEIIKEDPEKNVSFVRKSISKIVRNNKELEELRVHYSLKKTTEGLVENWVESDYTFATFSWTAYAAMYLAHKTIPLYHMQHFEELFFQDNFGRITTRNTYSLPLVKVANSKWLKNIITKYFESTSYLLNPGIDLTLFKQEANYLDKYYEKDEWTIVSFFDETREWKGFDDAVEAVYRVRQKYEKLGKKINWKVYGIHAPQKEYKTEFEYVGKIFNEDLVKFYNSADIVLLTSWYESFPLPPIEAMACGSLIISTQYGVEDYIEDGVNGLVCLPRKVDQIVDKLAWAIENPLLLPELVKNGVQTASEYSWSKRTDVLEEILRDAKSNYKFEKFSLFDDLVNGSFNEAMYEIFDIKN